VGGLGFCLEAEKPEARKLPVKHGESHLWGARCVSWHFLVASTIPFADRFETSTIDYLKRQLAEEGIYRHHWWPFWIIKQHMIHPGKAHVGRIGEEGQCALHFLISECAARGRVGLYEQRRAVDDGERDTSVPRLLSHAF